MSRQRNASTGARMDAILACLREAANDKDLLPNHRHFGVPTVKGWAMSGMHICSEMGWGYAEYNRVMQACKYLAADGLLERVDYASLGRAANFGAGVLWRPLPSNALATIAELEALFALDPAAEQTEETPT